MQGQVEVDGRRGRFDDLHGGARFTVIARDAATAAAISASHRAALESVGGQVTHLGDGGTVDVDGTYAAWLAQLGCAAVITRPDFYVYGGARDADELNRLLDRWRQALPLAA